MSIYKWYLLLKGLTQLWNSRRIYPKYISKCSVVSTDYVCNFLPKKYWVTWKILVFEISAKKGLRDVILGSEERIIFGSAIFTQFWRCKYVFVYYSNVQRTFKDGKIKSTVFTRQHSMKRHKSYVKEWGTKVLDTCQLWSRIFSQRGNWGRFDWYCDKFFLPAPNLAISTQT